MDTRQASNSRASAHATGLVDGKLPVIQTTPFGNYLLLEKINSGGMAEVFRAKTFGVEGFERLVAVKRILPTMAAGPDFKQMFVDEAKIAVQLSHANIAQVFDLGETNGTYYIAMEHVFGRDLRGVFDRCRQQVQGPMPQSLAVFIVMKMCEGLDYAHNKRDTSGRELGLIHRDVSPQNVLISYDGEVKLIDFGIAKTTSIVETPTDAGTIKGKVGYMSPEQVRGLPIDRRSDVFACGIILYELLTGERLFVGESDFATLEKVRNAEVLPPTTYNPKIPAELERIVLRALTRDVDDRYASAMDLHDALQSFVYTSAAFSARKDLAAWMRGQFADEFAADSAKLEAFQKIPAPRAARVGTGTSPPPVRRGQTNPPPLPERALRPSEQLRAAEAKAQVERAGRASVPGVPVDTVPASVRAVTQGGRKAAPTSPPVVATSTARPRPSTPPPIKQAASSDLGWDEEEKETQIYPGEQERRKSGSLATVLPVTTTSVIPPLPPVPPLPLALPPDTLDAPTPISSRPVVSPSRSPNQDKPERPRAQAVPSAPSTTFPAYHQASPRTKNIQSWQGAALISAGLLVGGLTVWALTMRGGVGAAEIRLGAGEISAWYLDGEKKDGALPAKVTGLSEGEHTVRVVPTQGFAPGEVTFHVAQGQTSKVSVSAPLVEVVGRVTSSPPGANVKVTTNGNTVDVGPTPIELTLDPAKTVDVQLTLDGYETATKRIDFSGARVEEIAVEMQPFDSAPAAAPGDTAIAIRSGAAVSSEPADPSLRKPPERENQATSALPTTRAPRRERRQDVQTASSPREVGGEGALNVSVKPPCEVLIDGVSKGTSPLRGLPLQAGKHKVTLVNSEYGISETITVDIKAGAPVVVRRDWLDRVGNP